MGRPPTALRWPDLSQPAAPPSEAERLHQAFAAQWLAVGATLGRLLAAQDARIAALEARDAPPAVDAEYVTTTVAARLLGVTPRTIARWARTGRVDAHDLNGWRVRRAEIETLARYRAGSSTEGATR